MAIQLVPGQTASAQSVATGTSIAVSFPGAVTPQHLLLAKVSVNNSGTVYSVIMTGETFAAAVQLNQTTDTQRIEGWYAKNTAGGQTQVTANFSATDTFRAIAISEWSGADTVAPLDQTASANDTGTAGAAISSPDKTPIHNGELIWGAVEGDGATAFAQNSPYTLLEAETTVATASAYQIQTVAAPVHTDFNLTSATHWGVVMATFRPAFDNSGGKRPRIRMRGPRVRLYAPFPQPLILNRAASSPVVIFDPALMEAVNCPWPGVARRLDEVVASGMTPPNVVLP